MTRACAGALALLLLLGGPPATTPAAAEEEAVRVFRLLRQSMVSAARRLYVTRDFADLVRELGGPEFPGAAARIPPRGQAGAR